MPLSSQLSGVAEGSDAETPGIGFEHFTSAITKSFTSESGAAQQIRTILDTVTSSAVLASLPAMSSLGNGVSNPPVPGQGGVADANAYAAQCPPGGPMNNLMGAALLAVATQTFNPAIRMVSPSADQVFAPGDTLTIQVELNDPQLVSGAEVGISGFGFLSDDDPPLRDVIYYPGRYYCFWKDRIEPQQ